MKKGEKEVLCFQKEEISFDFFLKKYLASVFEFIFYLVKNRTDADDLTQETFLKAWKNFDKFDSKTNFKAWLFTIAKNTALDFFKKKKALPFSSFVKENNSGEEMIFDVESEEMSVCEFLEKEDLKKNLEEKINLLKPHYQTVLLLHYKEDFSLVEIAEIMEKSYDTVKSLHRRALIELRKIFER